MAAARVLSPDDRNAIMEWITMVLHGEEALEFFEEPESRRRLIDYLEIAGELGYDEPPRETYPVERSLPALRRVLTEWRDIADGWLGQGSDPDHEMYRLELWAKCQAILKRLFPEREED